MKTKLSPNTNQQESTNRPELMAANNLAEKWCYWWGLYNQEGVRQVRAMNLISQRVGGE